ncbi:hypothetical protein CEXT_170871 [Caerostris extrusa]|uniref:Uncharacterized protein n=1 Tax=Caerostris extrusa TaxID=172846 RepID=A0AAV4XT22_CAEEX|nr:hypothetical protein CEXT_170871 [Caerostris extrusa]
MNFTFSVTKDPLAGLKRAGSRVSPRELQSTDMKCLWASCEQKQRHPGGQFDGGGIGAVSFEGCTPERQEPGYWLSSNNSGTTASGSHKEMDCLENQ